MSESTAEVVALFSYGTLRDPKVQLALFGRLVEGREDALLGYVLQPVTIADPKVVETSGAAVHTIACASGDASDLVPGVVLTLSPAELETADAYETDAYRRIEVTLASGTRAFVYVS